MRHVVGKLTTGIRANSHARAQPSLVALQERKILLEDFETTTTTVNKAPVAICGRLVSVYAQEGT